MTFSIHKTGLLLVLLFFVFIAVPTFAQDTGPDPTAGQGEAGGLVPCGRDLHPVGTTDAQGKDISGTPKNPCGFDDLIALGGRLTRWLVFMSAFIAAGTFTYAGYLYATAGGSEERVKKAHSVFKVTLIGFIIVLAAWLIVYTIGTTVVTDSGILQLE